MDTNENYMSSIKLSYRKISTCLHEVYPEHFFKIKNSIKIFSCFTKVCESVKLKFKIKTKYKFYYYP